MYSYGTDGPEQPDRAAEERKLAAQRFRGDIR